MRTTDSNPVASPEAVVIRPHRTGLPTAISNHTSTMNRPSNTPSARHDQYAVSTMLRRDEPSDRSNRATVLERDKPPRLSNRPAILHNINQQATKTPAIRPQVSAQSQINASATIQLPATIESHFRNDTDVRMAARQSLLTTLSSSDQQEQHDWAREFIAHVAPCIEGYNWKRVKWGYQCKGGHHLISDDLLAEGKGGFWSLPSSRDTDSRWGPYYSEKHLPNLFFYSGQDPIPYGAPLYCGEPKEYAEERYEGFRLRLRLGLRSHSGGFAGSSGLNTSQYSTPEVEQSHSSSARTGYSFGQYQPSHGFHYGRR